MTPSWDPSPTEMEQAIIRLAAKLADASPEEAAKLKARWRELRDANLERDTKPWFKANMVLNMALDRAGMKYP